MSAENSDVAKAFVLIGEIARAYRVKSRILLLVSIASYLLPTNGNVHILYKLDLYIEEAFFLPIFKISNIFIHLTESMIVS